MTPEHTKSPDIDPQVVSGYTNTFINRRDMLPIQLGNGTYVTVPKELTDSLIYAHIRGNITIGAYALNPNGWAKWICFDADTQTRWKNLIGMAASISSETLTPYLEPSRRGGHLWLFTEAVPGFQIRAFGRQLLLEHKLTHIEIYPKQDKPVTGPGSLVRLPLGIHKLTGKRYHFVNADGTPLAPTIREQLKILTDPQRVPQSFIDQIIAHSPLENYRIPIPTSEFKPKSDKRDISGPPSERIKSAISVYEFVSQYVELDERNKGLCPFHDDKVKSFQVSEQGNFWNCYAGCGGGSIIDFWMKWRAVHHKKADFKSTVKDLAKMLLS